MKDAWLRTSLILCLVGTGLAATDWSPTRLTWEGGEKSLAEAVAWLNAGGNATRLDPDLDGGVQAPVAFVEGTYWEAVDAICRAYNLYVLPPRRYRPPFGVSGHPQSIRLQVEAGPVRLGLLPDRKLLGAKVERDRPAAPDLARLRDDAEARRAFLADRIRRARQAREEEERRRVRADPDRLYRPCGMLLVCVADAGIWTTRSREATYSRARLACRLRVEPRIDLERIGPCVLNWARAVASNGAALSFFPGGPPPAQGRVDFDQQLNFYHHHHGRFNEHGRLEPTCTQLYGIAARATGFKLEGTLRLAHLQKCATTFRVAPGDSERKTPEERPLTVELTRNGQNGRLVLKYQRSDWLGQPQVTVRTPEGHEPRFYINSTSVRNDECTSSGVLNDMGPGTYTIAVTTFILLGKPTLPVAVAITLP